MSDRRRRQKEQRAAKREAQRKKESRKELGRRLLTALVFGLIVIGIFAVSGLLARESNRSIPGTYEDYRNQETACGAEAPPPEDLMSFEGPEEQADITSSSNVTATVATSCGDFVIELNNDGAPETVNSFVFLTRAGFYDGQAVFRISEDFLFQAGDPEADGTGGPGYIIADELPPEGFVYEEGVVALQNRGARSTGSQFFVITGSAGEFLTNRFNVLGMVVSGQENIDRIMEVPTASAPGTTEKSRPLETVFIESITIEVADS